MESRGAKAEWRAVPAFGEWEKLHGMPDYSLDFSKIREMRKQSKSDYSRTSVGNEEELIPSSKAASSIAGPGNAAPPVADRQRSPSVCLLSFSASIGMALGPKNLEIKPNQKIIEFNRVGPHHEWAICVEGVSPLASRPNRRSAVGPMRKVIIEEKPHKNRLRITQNEAGLKGYPCFTAMSVSCSICCH
ncbi:hypothetical protein AXF42_Ash002672 [Apostasia shenzhenica]|uniref:RIN4 pathogenic type III effector avirulence factor Avr cleavage site domain-containing protein n=1 Tax=Apostasia shenzhenica TaxID=1088818 RepID=A0A2I0A6Y3_9ASPA|nr:hypothetical protein AXF42_Ash002672 [Apostasia shenzhenica]